ncbi:MAG TPA: hypothetical protein VG797_02350 [Phycisphaerales bacterium]|nr:hypothetical protein [Phycisphaerales bacterium]
MNIESNGRKTRQTNRTWALFHMLGAIAVLALTLASAPVNTALAEPAERPATALPSLNEARANFLSAYEGHGRPRVHVVVNERAGQDSAWLRDALLSRMACDGAVVMGDPSTFGDAEKTALRRANRLAARIRPVTDLAVISHAVGLLIQVDAEPSGDLWMLRTRAIETNCGVTLVDLWRECPSRWRKAEAERAADELSAAIFEGVARRWEIKGEAISVRLRVEGPVDLVRAARIAATIAELPGVRNAVPAPNAQGEWTIAYMGRPEQFALDLRESLESELDLPTRVLAWGVGKDGASVRVKLDKAHERRRGLFAAGYALAKKPRISPIFNTIVPVTPPGAPERPLITGKGVGAELDMEIKPDAIDRERPEALYLWELARTAVVMEPIMLRALGDDGATAIDGFVLREAPIKSGRKPALIEGRRALVALPVLRKFAAIIVYGEATVERGAEDHEDQGRARYLVRAFDTDSGAELARAEASSDFVPDMLQNEGANMGALSAVESVGMRLSDQIDQQLAERWLEPLLIEVEFDPSFDELTQRAILRLLYDAIPGTRGFAARRDANGRASHWRLWRENLTDGLDQRLTELAANDGPLAGTRWRIESRRLIFESSR